MVAEHMMLESYDHRGYLLIWNEDSENVKQIPGF